MVGLMKRKNNLCKDILLYENALLIYKKIKSNMKNKKEIFKFNENLNQNILDILIKLKDEKYRFSKYNIFLIQEPKYRLIMSENINDKIVNHLISKYILIPSLEKSLIDTNVATRVNKGSEYALNKIKKYLNKLKFKNSVYVLKIDIKKYFYNIDHKILLNLLDKK